MILKTMSVLQKLKKAGKTTGKTTIFLLKNDFYIQILGAFLINKIFACSRTDFNSSEASTNQSTKRNRMAVESLSPSALMEDPTGLRNRLTGFYFTNQATPGTQA